MIKAATIQHIKCYFSRIISYMHNCTWINKQLTDCLLLLKRRNILAHVVYAGLVVWLSGNALVAINEVTLRQARLILGWVTVCGQVHHLGM